MNCEEKEIKNIMIEILKVAIEREKDSFDYYYSASLKACEPSIQKFLLELAEMEKEHRRLLEEKLKELEAEVSILNGIRSSFEYYE
ncbi:Rubrerythrin [Candidatus Kryptobacter tengchongensis]|uniref:Rubrerythrin n=1 Tax=Kryptobacter tengchongensis TaxID=1643429 RepID=A0A656D9F9_KRYT1|nr:ferritin family protein [Candidatus Kryptobacter tengchongensis]CUS78961.1 Rubrerythrin [Candidatus Kryptobacter tengchongensis]CUS97819.1 Rubrerythrin [Candidatus Kryptobacter tengchongensis]CUT01151.1 Rubrerythrin [Candidatus Kryptobacter tengchongensis]CUT03940.1 Rubrerythrin [Candidatus Kryptobacter tengchongensis]CUU02460.1 Rubrerythrin [Candidatus Kryptobacter tengchongensis]